MKLETHTYERTTPVHNRATEEVELEVGVDEVRAIVALIEDGDEDVMWLLLGMWAEHIYLGGENKTFVLSGTVMMPSVHIALGKVLDDNLNVKKAVRSVRDWVEDDTAVVAPKDGVEQLAVPDPGVTRVEMRPTTRNGHVLNAWAVMNDVTLFSVHDTAEEALEAYEVLVPPPPPEEIPEPGGPIPGPPPEPPEESMGLSVPLE